MRTITRRDVILDVRNRFAQLYPTDTYPETARHRRALARLDLRTCTEADVQEAIGNVSWTSLRCRECDAEALVLVVLGVEGALFDEEPGLQVCLACVQRAVETLKGASWSAAERERRTPREARR